MMMGSIQEDNITLASLFSLNIGAPKYINQILTDLKGKIDGNVIISSIFYYPTYTMDILSRQKISK